MYLQSFENNGSQPEQYYRYDPEIHGGKEILEKPFLLINSTSITVYNIHQRIQLQNRDPIAGQGIQIPQNRGCPQRQSSSGRGCRRSRWGWAAAAARSFVLLQTGNPQIEMPPCQSSRSRKGRADWIPASEYHFHAWSVSFLAVNFLEYSLFPIIT